VDRPWNSGPPTPARLCAARKRWRPTDRQNLPVVWETRIHSINGCNSGRRLARDIDPAAGLASSGVLTTLAVRSSAVGANP
jgi:hypothetical protein